MEKFLSKLKELFIKKDVHKGHGYYETILQNKEELKEMFEDCSRHFIELQYEDDKTDGYTNGIVKVYLYNEDPNAEYGWQSTLDHHYEITLGEDDRYWGYCQCKPSDIGYNPIKNCCGNGCDWIAPQIHIQKIHTVVYKSFDGVQRDIWELEKKWKGEEEDVELKQRQLEYDRLQRQIEELEERKRSLMKEE